MKRSPIGHVATMLLREIDTLTRIGPQNREKTILVVEDVRAIEWASLTFIGERHVLDLRIDGETAAVAAALAAIQRDLPEIELSIPGHFIAEIRASADEASRALRVEAQVLRD